MTTYGAGLQMSEVTRLRLSDIDSTRMLIRVEQGKRRKDRYTLLSPCMLEELRHDCRIDRPYAGVDLYASRKCLHRSEAHSHDAPPATLLFRTTIHHASCASARADAPLRHRLDHPPHARPMSNRGRSRLPPPTRTASDLASPGDRTPMPLDRHTPDSISMDSDRSRDAVWFSPFDPLPGRRHSCALRVRPLGRTADRTYWTTRSHPCYPS
jgi:hypothetical protein